MSSQNETEIGSIAKLLRENNTSTAAKTGEVRWHSGNATLVF
jgi:hypothetical protein